MPYVSAAQRGWAHTPAGTKALGGPAKVAEWDHASKGQHVPEHVMNKGYLSKTENYAKGGAVLGQTSRFMKTPDQFREDKSNATDENFAKGSKGGGDGGPAAPAAKDKSLKPVKPR